MSVNEMVEQAHGEIAPLVIAKKNTTAYGKDPDGTPLAEKKWMLAHQFMDRADKKTFGYLLKNMSNDHALGTEKCPKDVEIALQMIMLFQEGAQKKIDTKKRCKQAEDESPGLLFLQMTKGKMMKKNLCFKCGKHDHRTNECKTKDMTSAGDGMQAVQVEDQEQVFSWMTN